VGKFVLILLFSNLALFASSLENLSLQRAMEILHSQNPQLIIAKLEAQAKQSDIAIANALNWGEIDLVQSAARSNDPLNVFGFKLQSGDVSFNDFGFNEFDTTNPNLLNVKPQNLNDPRARNHFGTMLEWRLPLYSGGKIKYGIDATKILYSLSKLDVEALQKTQAKELKNGFYTLRLLQSQEKELQKLHETLTHLEDLATQMHLEGYGLKSDILEVQARKAQVVKHQKDIEANREFVLHFISFLLDSKVGSVDTNLPNLEPVQINPEDTFLAQKAALGVELGSLHVKSQRADFLPTVGLRAQWGVAQEQFGSSGNDAYTIGLEFRWNLYKGGSSDETLQKARIEHLKMTHQSHLATQKASLDIAQLQTKTKQSDAQIQSLLTQKELLDALVLQYTERYKESLVSMDQVLRYQAQYLENSLELNEARYQKLKNLLELEALTFGEKYENNY